MRPNSDGKAFALRFRKATFDDLREFDLAAIGHYDEEGKPQ